jgi:hypothetical protein
MEAGEHDARYARFVRWTLGATLLVAALLLAAMWWLDPISVTGRSTRFSVVENGGVRQAKLDLMERLPAPPDVLILGSSRSMQLDPADVTRATGASAFNGAVSGGTSKDTYLYARYAEQLWGDDYPHLVIGVVNDVLRTGGTAGLDPRLKRFLPRAARDDSDPLDAAEQLLQLRTLQAAWRSIRHVVPRDGAASLLHPTSGTDSVDASLATVGRQKNNRLDLLDANGMSSPGAEAHEGTLQQRIDRQMQEYLANSLAEGDTFTGTTPLGLSMLRRTIQLANAHGDVPTLWVTPFHPDAVKQLPAAYEARDRRFREAIRELQDDPSLRFEFVDLDDLSSFGGRPDDFDDGIHMAVANTRRVIEHLAEIGQLAPEGTPVSERAATG